MLNDLESLHERPSTCGRLKIPAFLKKRGRAWGEKGGENGEMIKDVVDDNGGMR
jgi:hypothetical protein